MNLIAGVYYDPAASVSKATTALLAMTVLDNVNLRVTFTGPPSGRVLVKARGGAIHGAVTWPQILVGCIESSPAAGTLRGRMVPLGGGFNGTAVNSTQHPVVVEYIVTGLTPGQQYVWDLAYGVEVIVASTGWKYGGPNNTTTNDAFGGISFEIWDPSPVYTPAAGAAPTTTVHDKLDTIDNFVDTEIGALATAVANVQADTDDIQARLPAALVGGRMDCSVGAMAANVITAAATAADFGTEIGTAVWATTTRALTDKAGFNVASIDATAVNASALAADAVAEIQSGLATAANLASVAGYIDTEVTAIMAVTDKLDTALELDGAVYRFTANALEQAPAGGGGGGLTAADVWAYGARTLTANPGLDADGVRAALGLAAADLDTQLGALPTAAEIRVEIDDNSTDLNAMLARLTAERAANLDNLDAAVSTRLASAAYTAPDNAGIAAVQAQTDKLAFTGGSYVRVDLCYVNGVLVGGSGTTGEPWGPA